MIVLVWCLAGGLFVLAGLLGWALADRANWRDEARRGRG